ETMSAELIWTFGLDGPHLLDEVTGQLGDGNDRRVRFCAVKPLRLQAVKWLVGSEQDGKRAKNDDVAGSSGNAEKGRPRAGALQSLHPTDRRSDRGAPIDEGGELLDGWRLEKRRKGQTAAESFFDLGKNSRRHQRPSADVKKIVSDSEARTFEQFLPDFNQLAFRVSAGLDALVFADGNLGRRRLEIRPDVRIAAVEADHQLRMIGAQGEAE